MKKTSATNQNKRAFKGIFGERYISTGNYQQDIKTGKNMAFHFKRTIYQDYSHQPEDVCTLNELIEAMPKGEQYSGLTVGLFYHISTYFELLLAPHQQKALEYKEQLKSKTLVDWLTSFIDAISRPESNGGELMWLSDIMLDAPTNKPLGKDEQTLFVNELSDLFNILIIEREHFIRFVNKPKLQKKSRNKT